MSAKEMFKKLGYKKLPKKYNKYIICYEKQIDVIGSLKPRIEIIKILFHLSTQTIQFAPYYRYSMKELQAINKQVEELGWLGEYNYK